MQDNRVLIAISAIYNGTASIDQKSLIKKYLGKQEVTLADLTALRQKAINGSLQKRTQNAKPTFTLHVKLKKRPSRLNAARAKAILDDFLLDGGVMPPDDLAFLNTIFQKFNTTDSIGPYISAISPFLYPKPKIKPQTKKKNESKEIVCQLL